VELTNKILKEAEKYGNAEILLLDADRTSVTYEKNEISRTENGTTVTLHIRLSKGNRFGYSQTTNLNDWKKCLKNANSLLKLANPLEKDIILSQKIKYPKVEGLFSKKIDSMSEEDIFKKAKDMFDAANEVDKRMNIPMAQVSMGSMGQNFANTNGINVNERMNLISAMTETSIGEASGSDSKVSHNDFDFSKVGKNAGELCVDSLKPKSIKTMNADLILDYFALADIIKTILIPAFGADNVQTDRSFLKGKLNQKVFSEKVSVTDDALLKNGIFSRQSDSEGTPGQRTVLVENGIVQNYIYDNYSALKDKAKSTGNCYGIVKVPYVGPTNFVIKPGGYKNEEIISETKEGVLAKFAFGTHVANVLTGDLSIGLSNAFYVKNGAIAYPIKQAMVSFNLFEALKKVAIIGKTIRQEEEVVAPMMRFDSIQIIGS